jgi:hypothetical protein
MRVRVRVRVRMQDCSFCPVSPYMCKRAPDSDTIFEVLPVDDAGGNLLVTCDCLSGASVMRRRSVGLMPRFVAWCVTLLSLGAEVTRTRSYLGFRNCAFIVFPRHSLPTRTITAQFQSILERAPPAPAPVPTGSDRSTRVKTEGICHKPVAAASKKSVGYQESNPAGRGSHTTPIPHFASLSTTPYDTERHDTTRPGTPLVTGTTQHMRRGTLGMRS